MKTTFQHKAVRSLAIVKTNDGGETKIELRSKKQRATTSDWWMYGADHSREFPTIEAAKKVALTVCPIFHGSCGPVADVQTFVVDAWGHWTGI